MGIKQTYDNDRIKALQTKLRGLTGAKNKKPSRTATLVAQIGVAAEQLKMESINQSDLKALSGNLSRIANVVRRQEGIVASDTYDILAQMGELLNQVEPIQPQYDEARTALISLAAAHESAMLSQQLKQEQAAEAIENEKVRLATKEGFAAKMQDIDDDKRNKKIVADTKKRI